MNMWEDLVSAARTEAGLQLPGVEGRDMRPALWCLVFFIQSYQRGPQSCDCVFESPGLLLEGFRHLGPYSAI